MLAQQVFVLGKLVALMERYIGFVANSGVTDKSLPMKFNGRIFNYGGCLFTLLAVFFTTTALPGMALDQVGLPEFQLASGEKFCAGKAFAVRWYRGRSLLLMPLHLLVSESGYPNSVSPAELASGVAKLQVLDLSMRSVLATAGKPVLKTGASTGQNTGSMSGDLMAFELPSSSRLTPFDLLFALAPAGTKVTILSKASQSSSSLTSYRGTITGASRTGLIIKLNYPLTALASSGAPVVDAQNKVVGMVVGVEDDARTTIVAIPSSTMISRIYADTGK